ncbi:MAG TPA: dephospho-CoA kinase [Longimicrobium sp.]|nr:dephospho-CoA kinase [Longimicrobium sp.]
MLKVGLTGNIAAGKSTVTEVWRSLGATVVDADELARRAVDPGTPAFSAIAAEWGEEVVEPDGGLDRAALRRIVFADPAARERLEQIVHPAVAELREELYREAEARGEPVIVADIPLLFEVGLVDEFDLVVLVDAAEETRLARLVGDRGLDPAEAQKMIAAQMPSALKRARADYVIENEGSRDEVRRRARDVWQELERRAGAAGG